MPMPKPKRESQEIEKIAKAAAKAFHQDQARMFCECSINLMSTCMPLGDVIDFLEAQIELLEEFG